MDHVGPPSDPVPFGSGHMGKEGIKGQCRHIRTRVAGLSCTARNGGFQLQGGEGGRGGGGGFV